MNPHGRTHPRSPSQGLSQRRRSARAAGFSLLEVILALAILAGALAVLGEAIRQGMRNAAAARDLTCAQLLCESKMAEITAGLIAPQAVQEVAFDSVVEPSGEGWLYSIRVEPVDQEDLLAVSVTVRHDEPAEKRPISFSLVRWMIDPEATTGATASDSTQGSTSATQGSQSSQGSTSRQ
jgi:type II secretion system protein I